MTTDWNDRKCSNCGALAHYRVESYVDRKPPPGLEFACKICAELRPTKTFMTTTRCANPSCRQMAGGRFEAVRILAQDGEINEVHYLCGEHFWRWQKSLPPEFQIMGQSIDAGGREMMEPQLYPGDNPKPVIVVDEELDN